MSKAELEAHLARIQELRKKDVAQVMADEAVGRPEYRGFLYVLSNPSMPGILKIGITSGMVEKRAAELSQPTSVPEPFRVECYFPIYEDLRAAESRVHKELDVFRTNSSREFFRMPLKLAEQTIKDLLAQDPRRPEVESDDAIFRAWLSGLS